MCWFRSYLWAFFRGLSFVSRLEKDEYEEWRRARGGRVNVRSDDDTAREEGCHPISFQPSLLSTFHLKPNRHSSDCHYRLPPLLYWSYHTGFCNISSSRAQADTISSNQHSYFAPIHPQYVGTARVLGSGAKYEVPRCWTEFKSVAWASNERINLSMNYLSVDEKPSSAFGW